MTHLVAPITVDSVSAALQQAGLAQALGASAVEWRVDRLVGEVEQVRKLVAGCPLPCIVTCRHACETGGFDGPESQRIALYAALASAPKPTMALDVELAKWREEPEWAKVMGPLLAAGRTKLILSSHDFGGRPGDLAARLARMLDEPLCHVPKLAWKAQGLEDCAIAMRLLKASREGGKPGVALAMGEAGMPSRILARKGGAFMTFAAIDKGRGTAPGQPLLSEMKNLYRWDDIKATTKVYGVIGCPVGHSMSPAIHNAGFKEVGFDGVYVPMRIEEGYENFERAVGAWIESKEMDFCGASVTIPHKESLLKWVREKGGNVDATSEMIGAANTVKVENGKVAALNTDRSGLFHPVFQRVGNPTGKRVAIIGAGGAARAAIVAFCTSEISVFNRTLARGADLAGEFSGFNVTACSMEELASSRFDVLINCTPLGMWPNVDASPLADNHPAMKPGVVVFDTVYNPVETKLLRQAKAAGCECISGTEMFVLQAAEQFRQWTGQCAPLDIFRQVLAEKLGS